MKTALSAFAPTPAPRSLACWEVVRRCSNCKRLYLGLLLRSYRLCPDCQQPQLQLRLEKAWANRLT